MTAAIAGLDWAGVLARVALAPDGLDRARVVACLEAIEGGAIAGAVTRAKRQAEDR